MVESKKVWSREHSLSLTMRLFRFLRASCAPAAAIVGFACLLTFVFVLYQPTHGPGARQRLGWQSWDIVTQPQDGEPSSGWNLTTPEEDAPSYPSDAWMPLWPHDTGRACPQSSLFLSLTSCPVSEIAITRCFVAPDLVGDMCAPQTSPERDAIKGKWVRVNRDLNRQSGVWSLVRRPLGAVAANRAYMRSRIYTTDEPDVSTFH